MLQIRDRLADRRLRKIQPLRGPAEAAGFDHRMKAAQFMTFDLHGTRITDRGPYLSA
jgi:hypothetical protein